MTLEKKPLQLKENPELQGLEKTQAKQILSVFAPYYSRAQTAEDQALQLLSDVASGIAITPEICALAKTARKELASIRIEAEKTRKSEKEASLRFGKALDGIANFLKLAVSEREEQLEKIEKHFEILEQQRVQALQKQRAEQLLPLLPPGEMPPGGLGELSDDMWDALVEVRTRSHRERLVEAERQRLEAEEAERQLQAQAQAAEQARQAELVESRRRAAELEAENARLRAEKARIASEASAVVTAPAPVPLVQTLDTAGPGVAELRDRAVALAVQVAPVHGKASDLIMQAAGMLAEAIDV